MCVNEAKQNYRNLISEAQFLSKMENYFNQLCKN